MAVRFSWTVQESDGDAVVGANVDLYYYGGAKYIDMIDNGDGSYYCNVVASGKYTVYINGTAQDEGTGIWIPADDTPTAAGLAAKSDKVSGAVNGNLAGLDTNGNLTDSGYDPTDFLQASHANANGAGGSSTPATNKVHNAAAIAITDAGGLLTATDVEAALAEIKGLIGTMDLSTGSFVTGMTTITNALLALNNQLYDLYLRGGDAQIQQTNFKQHYIFTLSGNSGASGYLNFCGLSATVFGFEPPRDGSITAVACNWSNQSMSGTSITIKPSTYSLMTINEAESALTFKKTLFPVGDYPVISASNGVEYTRTAGAGHLTDLMVLVEVTYGLATE